MPRRASDLRWLGVAVLLAGLAGCRSTGAGATGTLAGTVKDDATGEPVAGAEVAVGRATSPTDAVGRFELADLAVGDREVTVTAYSYETLAQPVEIKAGTNSVTLRLRRHGAQDGGAPDGGAPDGPNDGPLQHDAQRDGPLQHDAQRDGPLQVDAQRDGPCGPGTLFCGSGCATCPTGSVGTACSGSACVATACATGYRLCGSSCCAWTIEQVGWISASASEATLALDGAGQPRIAFVDYDSSAVKYAYRSGGTFSTETISAQHASDIGIAVDSYGIPHVAFSGYGGTDPALTYAKRSSGWSVTPIYTIGLHGAIAIDAYNGVHIGFMGYTASTAVALRRAYLSYGGSWRFDTVDDRGTAAAVGYNTSIAVTPSGQAHLLYWASVSSVNSLTYAYESGGTFYPSLVENVDFVMGEDGSIALDPSGYPYIGYPAYLGSQTTVVRAGYRAGSWYLVQADPSTTVTGSAAIALDPANVAHGVYTRWNGSVSEVVYATQVSTTWRQEVIGGGETWNSRALAIDSAGNPHVVFVSPYSASTRYVYYAH
jgi:hypothetical protein